MYSLDQGRFTVAAGAVGVIRACLRAVDEYANERETFGQQIGEYQIVQDMIAEMVIMYETSRLLVLQAAHEKNRAVRPVPHHPRDVDSRSSSRPSTRSRRPTSRSQIHGAYGYSAEYGVERHLRNSRAPAPLRGHDPDPPHDAGRGRTRLPAHERLSPPHPRARRRLASG